MFPVSRLKICAALGILLLASGCTDADWDRLNLFPGLGAPGPRPAAHPYQAPEPVEPVPPERETTSGWMPDAPPAQPQRQPSETASLPYQPMMAPASPATPLALPGSAPAVTATNGLVVQPGDDFCHQVALQNGENALSTGFTLETAQRRYDGKLHDCEVVLGD